MALRAPVGACTQLAVGGWQLAVSTDSSVYNGGFYDWNLLPTATDDCPLATAH